jgi:hypothetical protein
MEQAPIDHVVSDHAGSEDTPTIQGIDNLAILNRNKIQHWSVIIFLRITAQLREKLRQGVCPLKYFMGYSKESI